MVDHVWCHVQAGTVAASSMSLEKDSSTSSSALPEEGHPQGWGSVSKSQIVIIMQQVRCLALPLGAQGTHTATSYGVGAHHICAAVPSAVYTGPDCPVQRGGVLLTQHIHSHTCSWLSGPPALR